MDSKTPPKPAAILALHCLSPDCGGLLAYEVNRDNVLTTDLSWTARRDGDRRFFPCPKCGGKNMVEEITDDKGARRHKVIRWEA